MRVKEGVLPNLTLFTITQHSQPNFRIELLLRSELPRARGRSLASPLSALLRSAFDIFYQKLPLSRQTALGFPRMIATELLVQQNDSADVLTNKMNSTDVLTNKMNVVKYVMTNKTNLANKMSTADVLTNKMNSPAKVKARFSGTDVHEQRAHANRSTIVYYYKPRTKREVKRTHPEGCSRL